MLIYTMYIHKGIVLDWFALIGARELSNGCPHTVEVDDPRGWSKGTGLR